jgi:molybdate transport system substrate-binding protein
MKELGAAFLVKRGESVRFNFASSGTLARQIEAGAPADVFVSANVEWMDHLEQRNVIDAKTRFNWASNALVLVGRKGNSLEFDGQIPGYLAVGDFKGVPAGMYAKEALAYMGWLEQLKPKLVMAANVRTGLMYVERGEAVAAIVYASDALASGKISIIGTFPSESHSPIVYPVAVCSQNTAANDFVSYIDSPEAKLILNKHGFR